MSKKTKNLQMAMKSINVSLIEDIGVWKNFTTLLVDLIFHDSERCINWFRSILTTKLVAVSVFLTEQAFVSFLFFLTLDNILYNWFIWKTSFKNDKNSLNNVKRISEIPRFVGTERWSHRIFCWHRRYSNRVGYIVSKTMQWDQATKGTSGKLDRSKKGIWVAIRESSAQDPVIIEKCHNGQNHYNSVHQWSGK